jgi:hypothetical protein
VSLGLDMKVCRFQYVFPIVFFHFLAVDDGSRGGDVMGASSGRRLGAHDPAAWQPQQLQGSAKCGAAALQVECSKVISRQADGFFLMPLKKFEISWRASEKGCWVAPH